MEKLFIKNRHDKKIAVIIEKPERPIGLAFVAHGLGSFKGLPHIRTFVQSLLDNNYVTLSFDTTHTYGESEGSYEDATITNYYEDLEDVINWSKNQAWYQEPFILCGHSAGGMCSALYAEKHPEEAKALVLIAPVVSGQLFIAAHDKEELEEWERTGWKIIKSISQPGLIKKLKWSHVDDTLKYSLLPKVDILTMPVLIVVGESDDVCPLSHQEILFKALPGDKKELHIIKEAPHSLCDEKYLTEVYQTIDKWLKTLN